MLPTPATRDYKGGNSIEHLTRKDKKGGEQSSGPATKLHKIENWEQFPTQSPVCSRNDGFSERLDSDSDWTELPFLNGETNPLKPQGMQ
jgi:hypothetical protein